MCYARAMRYAACALLVFATACGSKSGGKNGPANDCTAPSAGPTVHAGFPVANETWTADTSPHQITANLTLDSGLTLTLEPCVLVTLDPDVNLLVDGTLVAVGTETRRITLEQGTSGSRFGSLWIRAPGSADLAYTTIEGGGSSSSTSFGATVRVEGQWPPSETLGVDNVVIRDSAGVGLWMSKWARFAAGSQDLTITDSGATEADYPFPLRMSLNTLSSIPVGVYTGNATDSILLSAESPYYIAEIDDTIPDRGIPYQMGGGGDFGVLGVYSAAGPTLTIEPGVEIQFFALGGGGLFVGNGTGAAEQGRVVAEGTQAQPILFTGVGPETAGMWEGVTFRGALANTSALDHVEILNAGAHGGDSSFGCPLIGAGGAPDGATDGAIKIFAEPSASFVTNTHIGDSSSHGIFRAWEGAMIDFMPSNTFTNVAWCDQVEPKPPMGAACPASPSCP